MKNTEPQKPSGGCLPGVAFIHYNFPWGGAERATMDILDYLVQNGHTGHVITYNFIENLFPNKYHNKFAIKIIGDGKLRRSKNGADAIIDYIKEHNIRFIISSYLLERAAYIREKTGVKYIFINHGEPFYERLYLERRIYKKNTFLEKCKWFLIDYPKIYWFHHYRRKYIRRYNRTVRKADIYVVLCEVYKNEIIRQLHLSKKYHGKFRVIGNSERPVEAVKMEKKKQVIYVGRLSFPDKRVDRLIEVWKKICGRVPDWELLIIGDGEERQNLEQAAAGMANVRFVGAVSNVQPYYDDAAVLCLTSASESWGFALTEAQSNGVVPVAFDCSAGVHHLLAPSGTNGILVPPGDIEGYARELEALIKDGERRRRMQFSVMEKAKDYSMEQVGRKWLDLFADLTAADR